MGLFRHSGGNLFAGNFGPTINIRIKPIQPFLEGLVVGAHTNFHQNVHKNCPGCGLASFGDWAPDKRADQTV